MHSREVGRSHLEVTLAKFFGARGASIETCTTGNSFTIPAEKVHLMAVVVSPTLTAAAYAARRTAPLIKTPVKPTRLSISGKASAVAMMRRAAQLSAQLTRMWPLVTSGKLP